MNSSLWWLSQGDGMTAATEEKGGEEMIEIWVDWKIPKKQNKTQFKFMGLGCL